jgi:methyl-accepting chemotaxis protein
MKNKADKLRQEAVDTAKLNSVTMAEKYASRIETEMEETMICARTIAQAFSGIKNKIIKLILDRDEANGILQIVLDRNPSFIGTYTAWEPGAFDDMDDAFAGFFGHDETGRFVPYWTRNKKGEITCEPLKNYDEGDYYLIPEQTHAEVILDPVKRNVYGQDRLVTSLVAPIMEENSFYGIAGIDLDLGFVQKIVDDIKNIYDGTAEVALIGHDGTVAGYTNHPDFNGRPLVDIRDDYSEDMKYIQGGKIRVKTDRGKLEAFVPIWIGSTTTPWAVSFRIPIEKITAEADLMVADANRQMWEMVGICAACVLIALIFLWVMAQRISRPIVSIANVAHSISMGEINHNIEYESEDEVGTLASAFRGLINYIKELSRAAGQLSEKNLTVNIKPKSKQDVLGNSIRMMVDNFKTMIGGIKNDSGNLVTASVQTDKAARQLFEGSESINNNIGISASSSEQISANMNSVAASVEQMSSNIKSLSESTGEMSTSVSGISASIEELSSTMDEITANSDTTANIARNGDSMALAAKEKMDSLAANAKQIGKVVETITAIADQTNLLALNATIEAASAGDAGKGFAVVANEVKELAKQTARATAEIIEQVETMQADTETAVGSIAEILEATNKITAISEEVARAIEQQNNAIKDVSQSMSRANIGADAVSTNAKELAQGTIEISRFVNEASGGAREIAENLSGVARSTGEMNVHINELNQIAQDLRTRAEGFNESVAHFKIEA